MRNKYNELQGILRGLERVLIAFSGGVDSSFLLKAALETLGREKVFAVIARSETYPESEIRAAVKLAKKLKARYRVIKTCELKDNRFLKNPVNRCYYCKHELFSKLKVIAKKEGLNAVLDGANYDDRLDFRPGSIAGKELGVRSPLKESKITKNEIRLFSKKMKLSTWDKPSLACLSSRIPYGIKLEKKTLKMVGAAEDFIRGLGFRQLRVRHHKTVARIEVMPQDISRILALKEKIAEKLKKLGYTYVTVDLEGFRSGSMNLVHLKAGKK